MAIKCRQEVREALGFSRYWTSRMLAIAVAMCFVPWVGTALARSDDGADEDDQGGFCSATARAQFDACEHEVTDDWFTARALCINVSNPGKRKECYAEADVKRAEGNQLCGAQHVARRELCGALGENRYDPPFDPAHFDNDFTRLTNPNPYFPLGIGSKWKYLEDLLAPISGQE